MNYLPGVLLIVIGLAWLVGALVHDWRNNEPVIQIHVTYNSLTGGHSKYTGWSAGS